MRRVVTSSSLSIHNVFKNRVVVVRSYHSEIMVDTDYFFDVSFETFRLVLEPSSVEILLYTMSSAQGQKLQNYKVP